MHAKGGSVLRSGEHGPGGRERAGHAGGVVEARLANNAALCALEMVAAA